MTKRSPIKVGFFVAAEASFISVLNVFETFRAANRITGETLFDQRVLTIDGKAARVSAGIRIPSAGRIADAERFDVAVVAASYEPVDAEKTVIIGALQKQARHGAMMWGLDTGVVWLIEAGVVGERCISPHWEQVGLIREQWPEVRISEGLYKIDGNLATCGGHTASIDFTLYYIQQTFGEELCQVVAKEMLCSGIRAPETLQPNAAVSSWKDHRMLKKALEIMEANIERPVTIVAIAEELGISCRQLEYLSSRHFDETPTQRYSRIRINHARELLLYSSLGITEIACACGFNSLSSFSRCFHRQLDCSPTAYRARFIGERVRPFMKVS